MFEYWYALPVVTLGCTLTVMGGVGGNVLCGPFFIIGLALPPNVAIGTALLTEVFSMGSGVVGYAWRRLIDYRLAALLAAAAVPMAVVGSFLSARAPDALLKAVFGGAIVFVAVLLMRSRHVPERSDMPAAVDRGLQTDLRTLVDASGRAYSYRVAARTPLVATSLAAGIGSGLVGIGGGELNTPAMVLRGVPVRIAAATAVAVMALTVTVGAGIHALMVRPLWPLAMWTIPGALLGGQIGSYIANRATSHVLKRWLTLLFVSAGAVMLASAALT